MTRSDSPEQNAFAFHTKNKREQSVIAASLGIATGSMYENGGYQGKSFNLGVGGFVKKPLSSKVILLPGGGMTMAIPLGNRPGATMEAGIGATVGFRFDWSLHSYGFVIPGVSVAGNVKAVTLEAGIGLKGKFKPQLRRSEASCTNDDIVNPMHGNSADDQDCILDTDVWAGSRGGGGRLDFKVWSNQATLASHRFST